MPNVQQSEFTQSGQGNIFRSIFSYCTNGRKFCHNPKAGSV